MAARTRLWRNKIGERTVMQNDENMFCPNCKVEMNFHAMKIDYTRATDKPELTDPEFGGPWKSFIPALNAG